MIGTHGAIQGDAMEETSALDMLARAGESTPQQSSRKKAKGGDFASQFMAMLFDDSMTRQAAAKAKVGADRESGGQAVEAPASRYVPVVLNVEHVVPIKGESQGDRGDIPPVLPSVRCPKQPATFCDSPSR